VVVARHCREIVEQRIDVPNCLHAIRLFGVSAQRNLRACGWRHTFGAHFEGTRGTRFERRSFDVCVLENTNWLRIKVIGIGKFVQILSEGWDSPPIGHGSAVFTATGCSGRHSQQLDPFYVTPAPLANSYEYIRPMLRHYSQH